MMSAMNVMPPKKDLPAIAGGKPAKVTPFNREERYGDDELKELAEALKQGTLFYAHGEKVKQFEAEFCLHGQFAHGVSTSSGTAAIHAALTAAGLSPGDEVIVPPITDLGTLVPILYQGAVPVFADLDPHTGNLLPASVEKNLTDKTRAILAVHLAGNPCDMDALAELAAGRGGEIAIIEDCAQAHGCTYRGKAVGHFGLAGCYSLNEFKHISCGDGGIVVTGDAEFAARTRLATDKAYSRVPAGGTVRKPSFLANNYRMTELQGAVARAQLRKLDGIVRRRQQWCRELTRRLEGVSGLQLPQVTRGGEHSYWFYLMRVDAPGAAGSRLGATTDQFADALKAEGLPVSAHYIGQPIYEYPLFTRHHAFDRGDHPFAAREYGRGLCPNAEALLESCIVLQVNEAYSADDLEQTVHAITRVARWFGPSVEVTLGDAVRQGKAKQVIQ
jgi:dTDP-4-amino-4,6-dideoxygalactose transaminase